MDSKLRLEMLERELHGLDVELQAKRSLHRTLTEEIVTLEEARAKLQRSVGKAVEDCHESSTG